MTNKDLIIGKLRDYLKASCRSWENDCDNENDTNELTGHLQERFPDLTFNEIFYIAKHWTGYDEDKTPEIKTPEIKNKTTIQHISMTAVLHEMKVWRDDMVCDIFSDWIDDNDKRKMAVQLGMLNNAIGNLEAIYSDKNGQIFKSSINR